MKRITDREWQPAITYQVEWELDLAGATTLRSKKMPIFHIQGDLLDQDVEVIVNAWNRNLIPWWLLIPKGISGAIKKRAGLAPFKELRKFGVLPLGAFVAIKSLPIQQLHSKVPQT